MKNKKGFCVAPFRNGERFTLVSISEKKAILKKNML